MLHLPIERLAELVDGGAMPVEREHLLTCVSCMRELEAYRRLVVMADDERRRIAPPLTNWDSLGSRLRVEGLVTSGAAGAGGAAEDGGASGASGAIGATGGVAVRARRHTLLEPFRRAAAVLVLVGGGAVLGRMTTGMQVVDAVAFRPSTDVRAESAATNGGVPATLASNSDDGFSTSQEALAALDLAQRQYEQAATWLASHDTSSSELAPEQYRTRLAALDRTAQTMQQAMRDAPSDPYINQYYLATLSAREQTLRRLGTTLPVGNKLGSF